MSDITGRLFVITGGPGSGKTTLVDALSARGYLTSSEAGRSIIRDQVRVGGTALPWADAAAFAELMLAHDLHAYRTAAAAEEPIFFDRGIPDVAGFLRLMSLPVPLHVHKAVREHRYNRRVFIAPPWPAIFDQDAERKQTFAEAVATYEAMVEVYTHYRYDLLILPMTTVDNRADFVLAQARGHVNVSACGNCFEGARSPKSFDVSGE
jgi:predicted ATPase